VYVTSGRGRVDGRILVLRYGRLRRCPASSWHRVASFLSTGLAWYRSRAEKCLLCLFGACALCCADVLLFFRLGWHVSSGGLGAGAYSSVALSRRRLAPATGYSARPATGYSARPATGYSARPAAVRGMEETALLAAKLCSFLYLMH
jgi:hypothetical protein